jgi:hypothetical protein
MVSQSGSGIRAMLNIFSKHSKTQEPAKNSLAEQVKETGKKNHP